VGSPWKKELEAKKALREATRKADVAFRAAVDQAYKDHSKATAEAERILAEIEVGVDLERAAEDGAERKNRTEEEKAQGARARLSAKVYASTVGRASDLREKAEAEANAAYELARDPIWAAYKSAMAPIEAAWEKALAEASACEGRVIAEARADFEKATGRQRAMYSK